MLFPKQVISKGSFPSPRIQATISVRGLIATHGEDAEHVAFPAFLFKHSDPQWAAYIKGRDAAFTRAEDMTAKIMKDDLVKYHASRVSPYGKSIKAIRTKIISDVRSEKSPLGRKVWIGYQPRSSEDQDSITSRGVTAFMLNTIYGTRPGAIQPPFSGIGPWARTKSTVGAIYGSKEYAGVAGGRLGYYAMTKGILPPDKYITKPQQRPRGGKLSLRTRFGVKVYDDQYAASSKAGTRRKPGRFARTNKVLVPTYVPYDPVNKTGGHFVEKNIDVMKTALFGSSFYKDTEKQMENKSRGHYSLYHGKVVSNKSIATGWKEAGGGLKRPLLPKGAKVIRRIEDKRVAKIASSGGLSDKTWENAAKFIAWSLSKKARNPKPVLSEWYNFAIINGGIMGEVTKNYAYEIADWHNKSIEAWKTDNARLHNKWEELVKRSPYATTSSGKTGKDIETFTAGMLNTGKFKDFSKKIK